MSNDKTDSKTQSNLHVELPCNSHWIESMIDVAINEMNRERGGFSFNDIVKELQTKTLESNTLESKTLDSNSLDIKEHSKINNTEE